MMDAETKEGIQTGNGKVVSIRLVKTGLNAKGQWNLYGLTVRDNNEQDQSYGTFAKPECKIMEYIKFYYKESDGRRTIIKYLQNENGQSPSGRNIMDKEPSEEENNILNRILMLAVDVEKPDFIITMQENVRGMTELRAMELWDYYKKKVNR